MNLADVIVGAVQAVPDRTALVDGDREISYAEVAEASDRAAAALVRRGVLPGDRVGLADGSSLLAIATVLGAARIGAAAAPMSPALTPGEMTALLAAAGCGPVGVAGRDAGAALGAALGAAPLSEEALDADGLPSAGGAAAEVSEEAVAVILFTSGTTSAPKAIPLAHGTLARRVRDFAAIPDPTVPPPISLLCVPFNHVAGLVGALVGLAGGTTTVLQRRFDAGEWLRLVEHHRVTRSFLVPAMLARILGDAGLPTRDLRSLEMITYGAAPAAADLVARAVEAFPATAFINVFGQTETLGAVTALTPEDHRAGRVDSVGKPMPGVEVRIVDPGTGDDVSDGDAGELWVRAPHTATRGWVRTGDLVRRDVEGYLYAAGRLSDVINRGGEKISPGEVADVLRAHPGVADAAVAAVPDAEMGERVGAVVVPRVTGPKHDLAEALRAWCRDRLAGYKVPERFAFVEALPVNELGKVSRRALLEMLEAQIPR